MRVLLFVFALFFSFNSYAINAGDLRVSFSDTVKKVSPAVVNIYTESVQQTRANPFFSDPFFDQFFSRNMPGSMRKRVERSLGSGVVVDALGHVITNNHVVEGAVKVKVVFEDKREADAEILGADKNMDIAVLKIIDPDFRFSHAKFGDSDALAVGDVVLALGNPFGVGQSVSMGIVSALGRSNLGTARYENFIQTDAAINPGNSGGPLVDSLGNVVGINTAIFSKSGGSQGIAFATPANAVQTILNSIVATGKVTRPWFGAAGQDVTSALAKQLGVDRPAGVLVNEVIKNSPAEKAGLEVGDIILSFDDFYVDDNAGLVSRIAGSMMAKPYKLTFWRAGEEMATVLKLDGLPDRKKKDQAVLKGHHPLAGYVVENLSPALSEELGMPLKSTGVVVIAAPENTGSFFGMDMRIGDLIVSVNKEDIRNIRDLKKSLSRRPRAWNFAYKRGKQLMRLTIR